MGEVLLSDVKGGGEGWRMMRGILYFDVVGGLWWEWDGGICKIWRGVDGGEGVC